MVENLRDHARKDSAAFMETASDMVFYLRFMYTFQSYIEQPRA